MTVSNRLNTHFEAMLSISIKDAALQKVIVQKTVRLPVRPFGQQTVRMSVPNRSGIELSYTYKEVRPAGVRPDEGISARQTVPFILTPKPGEGPVSTAPLFLGRTRVLLLCLG